MDPTDVLGISPEATDEDIRAAYLLKVREYPPDRSPEQFEKVREAYECCATRAGVCATACSLSIRPRRSHRSSLTRRVPGGSSAPVHGWTC